MRAEPLHESPRRHRNNQTERSSAEVRPRLPPPPPRADLSMHKTIDDSLRLCPVTVEDKAHMGWAVSGRSQRWQLLQLLLLMHAR